MSNILEEYLVKIGAEIDRETFNGASAAVNQLSGTLTKLGAVLKYAGIVAGIAKVTEAVVDNIKAVASADIEYQKLAQTMWTTKETAKAMSVVLKTMKASQEDVAWVPELREQFFRLRREMNELATPSDAEAQLRWIRDIGYDVQSLQLKFKMLKEWIVYYLIRNLQPYIKEFQDFVRWLNEKFGQNLPMLARKVALVLSGIVRVAVSLLKAVKWLIEGVYNFIDALPTKTKQLVTVFALAGAAIMSGPFGLIIAAVGTALLMLEDFFGYLEGRQSSRTLAPLWKWLTDENNPLKRLVESLKAGIAFILEKLTELFEKVFNDERQEQLKTTTKVIAKGVSDIADGLATIVNDIFGKKYPVLTKFWKFFGDAVEGVVTRVMRLGSAVGHLMSAIGKAMKRDWSGAKEEIQNILPFGSSNEKGQYVYKKLIAGGLSPAAAAGIVGNLMQESSMESTSIGDGGTSGGIAQWHNERWENLKKFAAMRGTDWTDLDTQIAFILHELNGSFGHVMSRIQNAKSPEQAAQIAAEAYEIPEASSANYEQRQANARKVYNDMNEAVSKPDDNPFSIDLTKYGFFRKNSYASGFSNGLIGTTAMSSTYNGGVVNVGGITINCGNVTDPKGVADAVGNTLSNCSQRLAANNGGVFV